MKIQIVFLSLLVGINVYGDNYFCTAYNNSSQLKFIKGEIFVGETVAREGANEIREVESYSRNQDGSVLTNTYTSVGRANKKAITLNLVNDAMQSIGYMNLSRQSSPISISKVIAGPALLPDVNQGELVFLVCKKNHKSSDSCILGCN